MEGMHVMKHMVNTGFRLLITVLTLLMVLMVFTNAFLRYAFATGIPEAEELSRYLFVWICFLGTVYAFSSNEHVGVDMFLNMMPEKLKKIVAIIGEFITLAVLLLMLWGGVEYIKTGGTSEGPATGIQMGYVSVSICVASIAMIVILLKRMADTHLSPRQGEGK